MATVYELGLQIGDKIKVPLWQPGDSGYPYQQGKHEAEIVGLTSFPNSSEVFIAPPLPKSKAANLYIYNPETGEKRNERELVVTGKDRFDNPITDL